MFIDYTYNPWLVALSVIISLMASFTGLSLTRGLSQQSIGQRQTRIIMAAVALGGGIWSMHFVAMLAMRFSVPVFYEVIETVASALIAILLSGLSLLILHFGRRTRSSMAAAGALLGVGILAMHYVGLSAIAGCLPVYQPFGIALAGVLAVGMGITAISIAYGRRTGRNLLVATLVFGAAVAAVHFTAMGWTGFVLAEGSAALRPVMANPQVAILVLISAFVISGAFLLSGASFVNPQAVTGAGPAGPETVAMHDLLVGRPTADEPVPAPAQAPQRDRPGSAEPTRLPYERDGKTYLVPFGSVIALRAEGHYTAAFLESGRVFCPWSITEAEERLPPGFMRVHRSYLVNLQRVSAFEKTKDHGYCLFDGVAGLERVPVSRTRIAVLRDALGL